MFSSRNSHFIWVFPLYFFLQFSLFAQDSPDGWQISSTPHPEGHAHNDYEHKHPLWEALSYGFTSLEADVWPMQGNLYVKHTRPLRLGRTPTLTDLYLKPLRELIKAQGGRVYPVKNLPLYLMIDIKTGPEESYEILKQILTPYKDLLTGTSAPLKIFLSGARPIQTALNDTSRWVGIDGRPGDLDNGYDPDFMPVISERYSKIISWKGKGKIPQEEFKKLKALADACHQEGKRLRLWASPETRACWETLLKAGVDMINTDKLAELDTFLREKNP